MPLPIFSEPYLIPLCPVCETKHHEYQGHVFASNRTASNANASNRAANKAVVVAPVVDNRREEIDVGRGAALCSTEQRVDLPDKQRWSREAYNAYQREYMRKRRSEA